VTLRSARVAPVAKPAATSRASAARRGSSSEIFKLGRRALADLPLGQPNAEDRVVRAAHLGDLGIDGGQVDGKLAETLSRCGDGLEGLELIPQFAGRICERRTSRRQLGLAARRQRMKGCSHIGRLSQEAAGAGREKGVGSASSRIPRRSSEALPNGCTAAVTPAPGSGVRPLIRAGC
jgi:hypothetical protein